MVNIFRKFMKPDEATIKIFQYILEHGPKTAYEITNAKELKISQPNVSRIIKRLRETDSIAVSETTNSPRTKNFYGPTVIGLFGACCDYPHIMKKFDHYYDKWIQWHQFENSAKFIIANFDDKKAKERKEILKEYFEYVKTCFERFEEYKNKMPVELQVMMGEIVSLYLDPEKTKEQTVKFYQNITPFRDNVERFRLGQDKFHDMLKDKTGSSVDTWMSKDEMARLKEFDPDGTGAFLDPGLEVDRSNPVKWRIVKRKPGRVFESKPKE